jgi:uncharacterized membrane protein YedE/YeeE
MPDLPPYLIRTALGLVLGIVLGFAARRGGFCTLGAIEDAVYGNDTRRLRAWMLAIAVAVAGVAALEMFAGLDLSRSIYTVPRLEWGGAIIGGLLFGLGMALVGTCGFGTLLRFGGGDLKALMTFLVMAFTAMMTMRGVTGLARIRVTEPLTYDLKGTTSQQLPELLGLGGAGRQVLAFAVAAALAIAALASIRFLQSRRLIVTGLVIGLVIVLGWWATGIAGFDPFATRRVESFSFVAPLGETMLYFMLASGLQPDFPVGAVLGVIVGAFLAAKTGRQFRWEALGCTIGQGISGFSTLALGSILAIASIFIGARIGLYVLVER